MVNFSSVLTLLLQLYCVLQEAIEAADLDEQLCSTAYLGRLDPLRALTALNSHLQGLSQVS
jgi:hypothetical protein